MHGLQSRASCPILRVPVAQRLLVHLLETEILWGLQDASGRLPDGLKSGRPPRWPEHGECVLVVPGPQVSLRVVAPPPGGRSRWAQALPYQIEDMFAADVESLHIAHVEISAAQLLVAAAGTGQMTAWIERAASLGLKPDALVPASLLIAAPAEGWRALSIAGIVHARHADGHGFAIEAGLANQLFEGAAVEWLQVSAGNDLRASLTQLSAELRGRPALSLLQARFAPQERLRSVHRQFAIAAVIALLAVLVGVAERWIDLSTHRTRAETARASIETEFREAFPELKRVVDPVAQMRTALARLGAGGGQENALLLLRLAGPALARHPGVRIQRLEYRGGALDIALRASDVPSVDALRAELSAQGALAVQLVSASAGSAGVDGLLRIRSAGGGS